MPKTLLRFSGALSTVDEMGPGTSFQTVIDDPSGKIAEVGLSNGFSSKICRKSYLHLWSSLFYPC